jgi:hypothetical protein
MHQHEDDPARALLVITDATTKAEIEEAIAGHRALLQRMPSHWTERRAKIHARIDALLEDWEQAPSGPAPEAD